MIQKLVTIDYLEASECRGRASLVGEREVPAATYMNTQQTRHEGQIGLFRCVSQKDCRDSTNYAGLRFDF